MSWSIGVAWRAAWTILGFIVCVNGVLEGYGAESLEREFHIAQWGTEQGLPENSATAMVQTADGYLWFGTFAGLVRFDGVKFTVFDPSNTPELPHGGVVNLHLDRGGTLWVSTMGGMVRMKDGKWFPFSDKGKGWKGGYIRCFAEKDGHLYGSTFDGQILELKEDGAEVLPAPGGRAGHGYLTMVDGEGRLWALQHQYLGWWDGTKWNSVGIGFMGAVAEVGGGVGRDGSILVQSAAKLWRLRAGRVVEERVMRKGAWGTWSMTEDSEGTIWITSYVSGLVQLKPGGEELHFTTANGLSYNSLRFVFEDREGNRWVGTSGGGLMRLSRRVFQALGEDRDLLQWGVKSIALTREQRFVVGTFGGGTLIQKGGVWETFRPFPRFRGGQMFVQSVLVDRADRMWIGTFQEGLFRQGVGGGLPDRIPAFSERSIHALFEDSQGRLWVGGDEKVAWISGEEVTELPELSVVEIKGARSFAENPVDGSIWIGGGEGGLYRWDSGKVEAVVMGGESLHARVNSILFETNGIAWVGTSGQGLGCIRGGRLSFFSAAAGFKPKIVGCLMQDGAGDLWATSNRGIWRIARRSLGDVMEGKTVHLRFREFGNTDGLASVECPEGFQPAAVKDAEGRLWFATLKGVSVVRPATVRVNTNPPPVVIERVSIRNDRGEDQDLAWNGSSSITVPAGTRGLGIHFTGLSFIQSERMRFSYRIGDQGNPWVEVQGRRNIFFEEPAPGEIKIRIRGCNNEGIWNESGASLNLKVLPYYWQTWWFRVLMLMVLVVMTAGIVWRVGNTRLRREVEMLESQRRLEDERARLASVLEATSDFVGFTSPSGVQLYINPAGRRMLGLSELADISHLGLGDLHTPQAAGVIRDVAIPHAIRHGTWSGEVSLRRLDGVEIPVSEVLVAHKDPKGDVTFLSMIMRDISEQKRTAEELRRSQKLEAIGRLAGGVAHDFNNLLGAIIGNLYLAVKDVGEEHPAHVSLLEIDKAVLRARDLVKRILTFGRKQPLDRRPTHLGAVVEEAVRLMRPTLPPGLGLETSLSTEAPPVFADSSQVHQVIVNLCTNAIHAMENRTGIISIALWPAYMDAETATKVVGLLPGSYACLTVRDTGVGMSSEVMSRIFEPFFTTKETGKGTGLGLSMVHGIMQNHEGGISVLSQPGQGTTFHLYFPAMKFADVVSLPLEKSREEASAGTRPGGGRVAELEGAGGALVSAQVPVVSPGSSRHVLYLDDEESLVFLAKRMLERLGYRVSGFTKTKDALKAYRDDPHLYDVVITDLNMPGVSGLEVAAEILKIRSDALVLLSSGYVTEEVRGRAVSVGISEVLYKPNTVQEFSQAIHRFLCERGSAPKVMRSE